jgi:hypothetical protein
MQGPNSNKPHINTFIKGMDKDTANAKFENTKYEHAENLRLLTEDGKSTGAMINVQGNEKLLSLHPIVSFTLPNSEGLSPGASIRLNGTGPNGQRGDMAFIYKSAVTNNPDGWGFWNANNFWDGYDIYIKTDSVVIEINDYEQVLQNTIGWGFTEVTFSYTSAFNLGGFIPEFSYADNQIIIGSTNLRDDIILFTTENTDEIGGPGYIWRVSYDNATFETTTKLIYSDYRLNFSTRHLIEAAARYETDKIENLYFTDNYNSIRNFNILDKNLWGRLVESIELSPEVTLIPAECTSIGSVGSGKLDTGTYQVSYRLATFSGQKTELAPWSIPISVNGSPETAEYWNYKRSAHSSPDSEANKSLEFSIEEVTAGFELLEVFLLKRGSTQAVLYSVDTIYIQGSDDSVSFNIRGTEGQFREISARSLEEANATFNVCKTLTIKDNRLLVGNVKSRATFVDYDAKAPRFKPKDPNNLSAGFLPHDEFDNPFNKDSTMDKNDLLKNYRIGPLVNGTQSTLDALGGGAWASPSNRDTLPHTNIQYRFTTKEIVVDRYETTWDGPAVAPKYPFSGLQKKGTDYITFNEGAFNEKKVYAGGLWNNYKNPYIESILKGYQRDEIYRFGILFYDKSSRPLDVKWIGDIRMPRETDSLGNEIGITREETISESGCITNPFTGTQICQYAEKELIGKVLGLNFTINIEEIKDQISGFSIVRAPRPNKDKTILAQGLIGGCYAYRINPYWQSSYYFDYPSWEENNFPDDPPNNYFVNMLDNFGTYNVDRNDLGRANFSTQMPRGNDSNENRQAFIALGAANRVDDSGDGYYRYTWDNWLAQRSCIVPYTPINQEDDGWKRFFFMGRSVEGGNSKHGAPLVAAKEARQTGWYASPDVENGTGLSTGYGKIIGNEGEGLANAFSSGLRMKPIKELDLDDDAFNKKILKNTNLGQDLQKINNGLLGNSGYRGGFAVLQGSGASRQVPQIPPYAAEMYWRAKRGYSPKQYYDPWAHRDKHYSIDITHGIIPNDYADNFQVGNETDVSKLGLDSASWFYQGVEAASRSNFAALPLVKSSSYISDLARVFNNRSYGWNDLQNTAWTGSGQLHSKDFPHMITNLWTPNEGQYGGTDPNDIANTIYISTGHYQKVDENTPNSVTCEVFGGDTMINLYEQTLTYPSDRQDTPVGDVVIDAIQQVGDEPYDVGEFQVEWWKEKEHHIKQLNQPHSHNYTSINFPLETTVNNTMVYNKTHSDYVTKGELENRSLSSSSGTWSITPRSTARKSTLNSSTNKHEVWPFHLLDGGQLTVYRWENTFRDREKRDFANFQREDYSKLFYSLDENILVSSEFDNRIYASQAKVNGEQSDSWVVFKALNFIDVDGHHGPINKLEIFNDTPLFFQDTGFGRLSINPKTLMPAASGSQLLLGTGDVLNDFIYTSTEIGSKHQWSIIKSRTGVYFFDANSRKFYRTRGTAEPLSDMKGLSAFFYNNITKSALSYDNTYHEGGLIGTFDPRYNEILFTFHDNDPNSITTGSTPIYTTPPWQDENWTATPRGETIESFIRESPFVTWDVFNQDLTDFNADDITPDTEWVIYFTELPISSLSDAGPNKLQKWLQDVNEGKDIRFVIDGQGRGGRLVSDWEEPTEVQVTGTYMLSGQFKDTIYQHTEFSPNINPAGNIERHEIDFNVSANPYSNFFPNTTRTKPIVLLKFKIPESTLLERLRVKMSQQPYNESRGWVAQVFSEERTYAFYFQETVPDSTTTEVVLPPVLDRSTLVYSEAIDAFTGFYSFHPDIYVRDDAKYFSPDPNDPKSLYIHNKGQKCIWYTNEPTDSILKFVVNPKGYNSKVFNNVEFLTQVVTSEGENILQETFNHYTVENEYQDVAKELLPYGTQLTSPDQMHARRRMRSWRMQVPRSGAEKARIRNPYVTMSFTYNNNEDKEITVNDMITHYMDVPM